MDLKQSRKALGKILDVSLYSVKEWEEGNVSPTVSLMPEVIRFLGYVPFADPDTMPEGERVGRARKMLGLTREKAAELLGVCVSTLSSWENGRGIKKQSYLPAIQAFVSSASRAPAGTR